MAKEKRRRVAKWVGLGVLWIALFVYFAYLRFPYESLRGEVEERLKAVPSLKVSFEGLGPSGTGGIDLEGIQVLYPLVSPDEPILAAESLTLRPLLTPLLLGRRGGRFEADAYDGAIQGAVVVGKQATRVVVGLDGLDLSTYRFFQKRLGRTIKGRLDAKVDLAMEGGKLSRSDGLVTVGLEDGEYQPFASKAEKGQPSLRIRVKHLKARLKVEKGKGTVEVLTFDGPDIEGNVDGTITLTDRLDASRLTGELRLRFVSEEVKKDVGWLLDGFGYKKNADGFYLIQIKGTLGNPSPSA